MRRRERQRQGPPKSGYIPPKDPRLFKLPKDELMRLASGDGARARSAREELERRRKNRAARAGKTARSARRRSSPVDYPGSGKPLAPQVLAEILDQPAGRFAPKLGRELKLADLDAARSERLPHDVRKRIAEAVTRQVRASWRTLAHVKPFAGLGAVKPGELRLGTRTRESLAQVPDSFLSEMDLDSLLKLLGMDVKSLLDLLAAVEARYPGSTSPRTRRSRNMRRSSERTSRGRPTATRDLAAQLPSMLPLHWEGMNVDDLPPPARAAALGPDATQDAMLQALLSRESIDFGRSELLDDLRSNLGERHPRRSVEVSLRRAGFMSERIPTLQAIADELDVSRERVRQIQIPSDEIVAAVTPSGALALSLSAWFALHPKTPLTGTALGTLAGSNANDRASRLMLRALGYPHLQREVDFWTNSVRELEALELVLEDVPSSLRNESSWDDVAAELARKLPGTAEVLDLPATVRSVGHAFGVGAGPAGALIPNEAEVATSLARKIRTFLRARAAPIGPVELAAVIQAGYWPFDSMRGAEVDPGWLAESAQRNPELLRLLANGTIALPEGDADKPTGHVGILYRILVENGGPISTRELNRRATQHGIDRNQVGMLIHSRRAPCLFPVARGVVGLVGRDEDAEAQHHPSRARRSSLPPADTPECFVFEHGWAVRLGVDDDLLRGGRWEVPPALAEVLGFRGGALRQLKAADNANPMLVIDSKVWKTHAGSLQAPLARLRAARGDLAFVLLTAREYDIVLRQTNELDDDPLTSLLWQCGLDPHDPEIRRDPWRRLGRVLGGIGLGREEVATRLARRGQRDLLELLDAATRPSRAPSDSVWPARWFYTAPLMDDTSVYAVVGSDGSVRIAIGVAGERSHLPADLLRSDGGLVWIERAAAGSRHGAKATLDSVPRDIAPAGSNPHWVRWARGEHAARLAALAGSAWEIFVDRGDWGLGDERFPTLIGALEHVGSKRPADAVPHGRSSRAYPRSALAFERAVRAAVSRGLQVIRADPTEGFIANFHTGVTDKGPTLLDALDARGAS